MSFCSVVHIVIIRQLYLLIHLIFYIYISSLVVLIVHYFKEKYCKVTETFGVITVDFSSLSRYNSVEFSRVRFKNALVITRYS